MAAAAAAAATAGKKTAEIRGYLAEGLNTSGENLPWHSLDHMCATCLSITGLKEHYAVFWEEISITILNKLEEQTLIVFMTE